MLLGFWALVSVAANGVHAGLAQSAGAPVSPLGAAAFGVLAPLSLLGVTELIARLLRLAHVTRGSHLIYAALGLAMVGAAALALAAFRLSFAGLEEFGAMCGVPRDLAWLVPCIIDGAILVADVAVIAASTAARLAPTATPAAPVSAVVPASPAMLPARPAVPAVPNRASAPAPTPNPAPVAANSPTARTAPAKPTPKPAPTPKPTSGKLTVAETAPSKAIRTAARPRPTEEPVRPRLQMVMPRLNIAAD
ncbi:Protein of uncharacterised function (DUF2637) [Nocardia otitidiscaviarum]|uniref:Protein of uncharacterized function (DUF2637) n=1 Tax=Nocardia otitidiscaviarum TaxID=1823 RepID=A0A379JM22_9NOCA|nr:DUF2637 domain-containing protein [Nocardia otitidiscaviarum]SUD49548.1 Protein of uncharacterised function (DUF2637) [Nocardia otitidiscaviarum]